MTAVSGKIEFSALNDGSYQRANFDDTGKSAEISNCRNIARRPTVIQSLFVKIRSSYFVNKKMCEVTRSSFKELCPTILSHIDAATFVSVDTEFTGLHCDGVEENSLFDTAEERYQKLKVTASKFIICQLGISSFVPRPGENSYDVYAYNFFICPAAHGRMDSTFSIQVSSLQFLCDHNFNFNKLFYDGIPYLNKPQEECFLAELQNSDGSDLDAIHEVRQFHENCSSVVDWAKSAKEGDRRELTTRRGLTRLFSSMLNRSIADVWTTIESDRKISVEKVSAEKRKEFEEQDASVVQQLLQFARGISIIFQHLANRRKPLIGHNLLLDLLLMYNYFHEPLPETLQIFKQKVHELFPIIYDTKHVSYQMRKELETCGLGEFYSLLDLYKLLSSPKGRQVVLFSPNISLSSEFKKYDTEMPHEAGYDSYIAGYVFLRLAHFHASSRLDSTAMRPLSPAEHMKCLSSYCNSINVIRAQNNYINLSGADPVTRRPKLLIIQSKEPLNLKEVAKMMSRFGSVDLRPKNRYQAYIAVANFRSARDILREFCKHPLYQVTNYNILLHSSLATSLLWTSFIVFGGIGLSILIISKTRH